MRPGNERKRQTETGHIPIQRHSEKKIKEDQHISKDQKMEEDRRYPQKERRQQLSDGIDMESGSTKNNLAENRR